MILSILLTMVCSFIQQSGIPENQIKKDLIDFLKSEKEIINDHTDIYLLNLVNYEPYYGEKGIFKFGVLGSHHLEYLVFINDDDIEIISNYSIDSFLPKLNRRIQKSKISEAEKLNLLKNIASLLKRRYESIQDRTIPEDIKY